MSIIPPDDPLTGVILWRNDSITLSRVRDTITRLDYLPPQPCVLGNPEGCTRESPTVCVPCALRQIRADLFGEQPRGETDGPAIPGGAEVRLGLTDEPAPNFWPPFEPQPGAEGEGGGGHPDGPPADEHGLRQ